MDMFGFNWKTREIMLPPFGLEELACWLPSTSKAWILELYPLIKQTGENVTIGLDLGLVSPVSC